VVTTVAGTNLMERIAAEYGVALRQTPVGFKHIAQLMRTEGVLFGGEESGGFGFRGCVPERDGLLAGLLILEMMAMRCLDLRSILADLRRRFGHWFYLRGDLELARPVDPRRLQRWARAGAKLPDRADLKTREIQTLDGVKLIFEDKAWLLMRPSGTEPLLRIYAEARTPKAVAALVRAGQRVGRQLIGV
jgi:phosphomannomutase